MKHKIKVWYKTGNSFGSENAEDFLEMEWENIDVAKANLKRIKEHYICYKVDEDYNGKKGQFFKSLSPEYKLMYDTKQQQDWYSDTYGDYHYTLVLKADNGNDWNITPFWVGYFERLNEAGIVSEDSDTHFKFDDL